MFDHVGIHVADRAASEAFYRTVLAPLGMDPHVSEHYSEWDDFAIAQATADRPAAANLHIGFVAPDRGAVDAFHAAGVAAGYRDAGAPGLRPQYLPDYYGAFLLDPDGNSAEAVVHGERSAKGNIDHLWIRVADVAAAKAFYAAVAPHTGFALNTDRPDRASFEDSNASFSVVADGRPVTRNLHIAFPASDTATVDAFHAAALAAGYRDNGAPGERPQYHPGYYGGFVLDPDGTNVEVVCHQR